MAKWGPYIGERPFYFGRRVCAICLGSGARRMRYLETILVDDAEVAGGTQHVHLSCYRELVAIIRRDKLASHQKEVLCFAP